MIETRKLPTGWAIHEFDGKFIAVEAKYGCPKGYAYNFDTYAEPGDLWFSAPKGEGHKGRIILCEDSEVFIRETKKEAVRAAIGEI